MKKYLTKFSTRAEYSAALANLDYPNVSYVDGEEGVIFNPEMPLIVDNKISGTHTGDDILLTFAIAHGDKEVHEEVSIPVTGDTWEYEWTGEDKIRWFGNWNAVQYTSAKMSAPMLKSAAMPVYTLTLDHFGFDISNLISFSESFGYIPFKRIDVHGIDVSTIADLSLMFMGAEVESIDMHGVDMRNATRMESTFAPSDNVKYLNLDGCLFNTEKNSEGFYTLDYQNLLQGFGYFVIAPTISLKNSDAGTLEIIKDALTKSDSWNMDTTIDTGDLIWTYNQSTKEWEGNAPKDEEPQYALRVESEDGLETYSPAQFPADDNMYHVYLIRDGKEVSGEKWRITFEFAAGGVKFEPNIMDGEGSYAEVAIQVITSEPCNVDRGYTITIRDNDENELFVQTGELAVEGC